MKLDAKAPFYSDPDDLVEPELCLKCGDANRGLVTGCRCPREKRKKGELDKVLQEILNKEKHG